MIQRIEFDKKANAVYIYFSDAQVAYTKKLDDFRYVDYDSQDSIVGVELLRVDEAVITDELPNKIEIDRELELRNIRVYA